MELKLIDKQNKLRVDFLLIVPYGIETCLLVAKILSYLNF